MYQENVDVLIIYVTSYLLLLWFFVTLDIPVKRNGREEKNSTPTGSDFLTHVLRKHLRRL